MPNDLLEKLICGFVFAERLREHLPQEVHGCQFARLAFKEKFYDVTILGLLKADVAAAIFLELAAIDEVFERAKEIFVVMLRLARGRFPVQVVIEEA